MIEGPVVKTWDEFTKDLKSWFPDFYIPILRYPLRGGAKIVQFAKETNDLLLQMPDDELQLSKLHMANVEIPYNLLPSYEPVMYDFEKFGEMLLQQQKFSQIFQNFGHDSNYLIIINSNVLKEHFDLNIDKVDTQEARQILAKIFGRSNLPLIYYKKSKSSEKDVKNWTGGNKNCDLITDSFHATGFESESVIVFWTHTKSLSAISRATIKLVIVEANIGLTNIEKDEKYIKDKMVIVNWDQKEAFYFDDWSSTQHLMLRIKFGTSDIRKPIEYEVANDEIREPAPDYIVEFIKTSLTTKFYPHKNRSEPIDLHDKDHAILFQVIKDVTYSKFPFIDYQINCDLLDEHELFQEICNLYDLNYYLKHPLAHHIKYCFPVCQTLKEVCISKDQKFVNIFSKSIPESKECKTCDKPITKYNWIKHLDH